MMKCSDCPYLWKDENDDFPCCHFGDSWKAPCEYDDEYEPELDEEGY